MMASVGVAKVTAVITRLGPAGPEVCVFDHPGAGTQLPAGTLLPGEAITWEAIYNATAITYPAAYRTRMQGEMIKTILEDVADNLCHPDPYYQQGGDMVRVGGVSYTIDIGQTAGRRISDLRSLRTGQPLDAAKEYTVSGWASVNEGTEGPPIWDVVMRHIERKRIVAPREAGHVRVVGN